MYSECNCINTSFHKFEFEGKELTQQECMDRILEGLEIYLTKERIGNCQFTEEDYKKIQDSMALLGVVWWALWW